MLWYLLKLAVVLPLIAGLAWASLRFAKRMEKRFSPTGGVKSVKIIETQWLGPGQRIAVLEFRGREILVSATRQGLVRLAEVPARVGAED
ncbi:flagellar biosynthetic protein FliO [Novosphingobium sp.]|uniref:flagellar biosynthetic protein FliO n=1 Tax=Novosphingobium sp. TaxID=1874826 RepID=UPI001DE740A8|nr:flagellar biosynthetic protein FliO [Novosphingobium sp.]MBX9662836.1 flagellar biosynthetic protein FliO [Novosphingobium sp.]